MEDEQLAADEAIIKEYPRYTRWLEEKQVKGIGNLILTDERLVFLHQIRLSEEQTETLRKLSGKLANKKMLDLILSLHKRNFQVSLSSVISVKTGLYSIFPFPRPCLRIYYRGKKQQVKTLTFMFTIPLWKSWFQFEFTTIWVWVRFIRMAVRHKQLAAG